MAHLFDLENLITHVGPDAVKIKQEPGLPEKSSNEILTELFSTFDTDAEESSSKKSDDNDDDNESKKKKKKSKKKHKHKDKKHKKKERKHSTCSENEAEDDGLKKKKKHKKKTKRKRESSSSDSQDSDVPKIKIKKEIISPADYEFPLSEVQPFLDKVKAEPEENFEDFDIARRSSSPILPSVANKKNPTDDLDDTVIPRLLEKSDQSVRGKILIKDLKNSAVYNETVKEVENKEKEKAARVEDGEISDSDNNNDNDDDDNRTPTLSPSPSRDDFETSFGWSRKGSASPKRKVSQDLRYVLKEKEKLKKLEGRRGSRNDDDNDDNRSRSSSSHPKKIRKTKSRERESRRARSSERRRRGRSGERRSEKSRYSGDSRRHSSEDRNRDRYSRGRSRSRERRERIEIDKKKLLEIARKNAITMIKRGTLPLAQQDKAIAAIQAGGKSVDELIDFCKSLSKSEALGELSSVSSDEGGGSDTGRSFHHPFLLKERPNSIIMNIRDSKQIPTKTFQERTAESSTTLRLQFPVSSGQHHRKTENEWVDVIPTPPQPVEKPKPKKAFVPASTPTPVQQFEILPPSNAVNHPVVPVHEPSAMPVVATLPTPSALLPGPTVFPQPVVENVDIGSIVSQRLAAMRKLRENPHDVEALNEMYHAQNGMKNWAESKQMPGQFTGSTGVKVLTPAELTSGFQAWARKDQLTSAMPVSGGMGMALLQKMGWRPGEGLGKNKEGTLIPLQLEVKLDKKGLVSEHDVNVKIPKTTGKPIVPVVKTLEGKHPVSLLGEFCSKRKYGAPVYELCFECGPDHKKNFLFKVKVNGMEYKPSVASPNKKQAKAEAAQICLQTIGLLKN